MEKIEPNNFDAILVSSGLPEILLGSALATAGYTVLIIDRGDCYGGAWASHSADRFSKGVASTTGETVKSLPLKGTDQQLFADAGRFILDMCPKVLYQGETLVDALVAARAFFYLEFKLVEGSYLWHQGGLVPVPAARSDIFLSKQLAAPEKRVLMRFLTNCMEAEQGQGRLKDSFGDQPLVDLLRQEGMSQHLQNIILYGIAMANTPQHPLQQLEPQAQHQEQQQQQEGSIGATGGNPSQPSTTASTATIISSSNNGSSSSSCRQRLLTAAEGRRALQLYAQSVGRYSSQGGAFMVPCYGSGSLPEAFVRVAAVAGAVTVLRCAVEAVQAGGFLVEQPVQQQGEKEQGQQQQGGVQESVQQQEQQGGAEMEAETASGCDMNVKASSSSSSVQESVYTSSPSAAAAAGSGDGTGTEGPDADQDSCSSTADVGANAVGHAAGSNAVSAAAAAVEVVERGYKLTTADGQVLFCDVVVGDGAALAQLVEQQVEELQPYSNSSSSQGGSRPQQQHQQQEEEEEHGQQKGQQQQQEQVRARGTGSDPVSTEAVAHAIVIMDKSLVEGESVMVFAVPPGALGEQQQGVIRGLQLGPEAHVAPQGKKLLYLSTPCGSWDAGAPACAAADGASGGAESEDISGSGAAAGGGGQDVRARGADAAEALLSQAVEALVDTTLLKSEQGGNGSSSSSGVGGSGKRPQALAVMYFMRTVREYPSAAARADAEASKVQVDPAAAAAAAERGVAAGAAGVHAGKAAGCKQLPACCISCPGPDTSMMGYEAMTAAAQALMQQHLPGVPWITDTAEQRDAAGAVVVDEEEAIDELTRALQELSAVGA